MEKTAVLANAILHKDVRGKELYYLNLTNGEEGIVINVGKTTYENVQKLENKEPTVMPKLGEHQGEETKPKKK